MLNEPITSTPSNPPAPTPGSGGAGAPPAAGIPPGGVNPAQVLQMMSSLPPEQQAQMAAAMGMSPEQLTQITQMMASMPPEAMQQMMASMGGAGGPGGPGGPPPGMHTIQLTEEEAAAVNRLCDMGFDRNDVIQAYLACEKNEALAANFLMDSMSGGFGGNGDS